MPNVLIHKANELKPETRAAVEAELGRSLDDDEDVSIMAFSMHDAPAVEARQEAGQRLDAHLKDIDSQAANGSEVEAEAALNEALKNVRPGYREREGGLFLTRTCWPRAHRRAQGPARRVLLHMVSSSDVLIISPYILGELERVLTDPRLLRHSGLTSGDIVEYLENLALLSCLVMPRDVPDGLLRDPTDAPILGTALAGNADVLCTRDADFFEEKVQRFCGANGI